MRDLVLAVSIVAGGAVISSSVSHAQDAGATMSPAPPPLELPDDDGTDRPEDYRPSGAPTAVGPTAGATGLPLDQVVELRSGRRLRCAVIETVPDQRVVVVLATGARRVIRWADVVRVVPYTPPRPRSTTRPATAPSTTRAAPTPPSRTPPAPRTPSTQTRVPPTTTRSSATHPTPSTGPRTRPPITPSRPRSTPVRRSP